MIRLVAALLLVGMAVPATAETIADAVTSAYRSNPQLGAARARQAALGETAEQARSLGRLTAEGNGAAGYDRLVYGRGAAGTASAALPIWAGGRVKTAVRAAEGDVAAGREGVRDAEAAIVEAVAIAYADLLFDQQAVAIAKADIDLLEHQVAESRERFRLGNATRTDVARLEAQRAGAVATLARAEATLVTDAAGFRALVGRDAGALAPPGDTFAALPPTLDAARERALDANPLIRRNQRLIDAADARIDQARADGAPFVAAGGSYGRAVGGGAAVDRGLPLAASAGVTIRVPILTGGLVASQVREARAGWRAARFDAEAAAREAVRATDAAWANLAGARAQAAANADSAAAAEQALKGVRAEYAFGLRSTLDILVADERLRAAQLALARARGDTLIAQAALLRATGRLDDASFGPAGAVRG